MIIRSDLLRRTWSALPLFPCPTCERGFLEEKKKLIENTQRSLVGYTDYGSDPEDIEGRFYFLLQCKACGEGVGVSGTTEQVEESDEYGERGYVDNFEVLSMIPSLRIISIPEQTPPEVATAIRKAEQLWFPDASAAANQFRIACERLMDVFCPNHSGKYISLDARIKAFGGLKNGKHQEQADMLLSAKWIGNHGSHGVIKDEDVYFEAHVLAQVLHDLYDDTKANLLVKAKAINTNKGPLP